MFMAYFQIVEYSNDGAAVGDLLGFVLKVENYNESRTPVRHPSVLKIFLFVSCYKLIKNNNEQGA